MQDIIMTLCSSFIILNCSLSFKVKTQTDSVIYKAINTMPPITLQAHYSNNFIKNKCSTRQIYILKQHYAHIMETLQYTSTVSPIIFMYG